MTTPDADSGDFRDQVIRELQAMEEDLLWTEKAQFAHAEAHARINLWLGLIATAAASIAAAAVVAKAAPVVTGIAALVAALGSGLLTFLKPLEAEKRHLDAGRQLGALRVRTRQALHLDVALEPDPQAWRELVSQLATEKAKIDQAAPATSGRSFRAARAKIEAGHFLHAAEAKQVE